MHAPVETFTIITTAAEGRVRELHDRMPVIVAPMDIDTWLAPTMSVAGLQAILASAEASELVAYPVSPRVNSVRNDDGSLIEPPGAPSPERPSSWRRR